MSGGTATRGNNDRLDPPFLALDVATGSHSRKINQSISLLDHERAGPGPTKLRCHFDGGSKIAVRARWSTVPLLRLAMVT